MFFKDFNKFFLWKKPYFFKLKIEGFRDDLRSDDDISMFFLYAIFSRIFDIFGNGIHRSAHGHPGTSRRVRVILEASGHVLGCTCYHKAPQKYSKWFRATNYTSI